MGHFHPFTMAMLVITRGYDELLVLNHLKHVIYGQAKQKVHGLRESVASAMDARSGRKRSAGGPSQTYPNITLM